MLSLKGWKGCLNWVNWGNFSSLMHHQGFTSVLFWLDQVFDLHRNHLESSFPWSSGIFPASYSSVLSALHFFLNEIGQLINSSYSTKPKSQQQQYYLWNWIEGVIQIQFNSQKAGHLECTFILKFFSFSCFPSFSSCLFSP